MNRTIPFLATWPALCLAWLGPLAGCSSPPPAAPVEPEAVSGISVATVQKSTVPDFFEAVGAVHAGQTSQIASQMMGTILEMRVREGDQVEPGQVLAVIDDSQARATVEQSVAAVSAAEKQVSAAAAALSLAESTLGRYRELYEKKSVSSQEFDEAQSRYQSAQAQHEAAQAGQAQAEAALARSRAALAFSQVRAPFAGVVTERRADPGSLASPGAPLFTLEDRRAYRLEVTVDESSIGSVRAGQTAAVRVDSLERAELSGRVSQIVPAADPASHSFLVKITLPQNSGLRSGLFGRARFTRGERTALLIPRAAVIARGQMQGVYVIGENQVAALRYVTLGPVTGELAEVLSGLEEGERIVTSPGRRELAGKRILAAAHE